ncbi:GerAB/ArcD/ProY family transporter [Paenibacillus agricola]|uniref:Endospore germination permease n=1 Tax=Paenibacillus agricola TaxID=2716264 RepID=A0ABX0J742_9BACL|nr:endospore germination permease [Paenibacillus agricola]NHN31952.1 endospore germination permease [Paenibacillus agricola]
MDQKQIINHRQFAWLTASLLTGGGIVSIQQVLIRVNRMDAWTAYMLPMLYTLGIAYIFSMLVMRFPGKHIFEITKIVFGTLIGTIVNLVLLFHLWLILVRDISSFSKFIGITLLPSTPDEMILLLLILLLLVYGKTSVEVLARVNDLFFPYFVLMILFLPLALSNEMDLHLVQPVLAGQWSYFLSSNILSMGWYGDIFIMGAFLHTLWGSQHVRSAMRHGAFLASFMLGLFLLLEVFVLGPTIPGNLVYPNYSLIQQIHITDFLDRVDLVILSIWFPVTACEVILIYLAFLTGFASLIKQRDYDTINTPIVLLLLMTTPLAFKSTSEVFSFGNFSSPIIMLCYQPVLFLLLALFSLRYPIQQQQQETGKGPDDKSNDQANKAGSSKASRRHKLTYEGWGHWTHSLVALSLAALVIGLWKSRHWASLGLACGITYGICTILLVVTTYMEMHTITLKNYNRTQKPTK